MKSMNRSFSWSLVAMFLVYVGPAACGAPEPSAIVSGRSALTAAVPGGTLVIQGVVIDTSGVPLDGVQVTLGGAAHAVAVTDLSGSYGFTVNSGSYTVAASGVCGTFDPNKTTLANVAADTTVNFVGGGSGCTTKTSSGATSGSLVLSGVVTSSGHPVPGATVTLSGKVSAVRITDEAGAYSFAVNPGMYMLRVTGACSSFSPAVASFSSLTTSRVQNFTGNGTCPPAPLALCPTLDAMFLGENEPVECDIASNQFCAFDRTTSWGSDVLLGFLTKVFSDCRFAGWLLGSGALTNANLVTYLNDMNRFELYFFGCPAPGLQAGPLSFQLIPAAFKSRIFTSADLKALSELFSAAIADAVANAGGPPLTADQRAAVDAQLGSLAAGVPKQFTSSNFSAAICP